MADIIRIGAICKLRGSKEDWRVIDYRYDGSVYKYVVQSLYSGITKCVFTFEIFEKYTSTYKELNDFLTQVTGIGLEDMSCLDDEMPDPDYVKVETGKSNIDNATREVLYETLTTTSSLVDVPELVPGPLADTMASEITSETEVPKKRFKAATETSVNILRAQNTEKTTDRQTKWAVKLLKDWMKETGYKSTEFEWLEVSVLDKILQNFYASVQTKKGDDYSKAGLIGLRAGINRYLTTPPVSRQINIMKDRDFMFSNQVLSGLVKGLKREGKDLSKHKEPITEDDVNKLFESGLFSEDNPRTLQNKVLYDILSQFGLRGQEGLHDLRKDSFVVKMDSKGR
ncbi:uncharacterized protein LOC128554873 [Mercenaria mercenaria]|uniref:uncharacterized protein LOC128554873 n=1 Tax=Mercenaria mercenaria TaxID=6596 RepID=UPI00234EC870|nr:uncharacterized protein LOC128554873 [Mercenaria mercenaria]